MTETNTKTDNNSEGDSLKSPEFPDNQFVQQDKLEEAKNPSQKSYRGKIGSGKFNYRDYAKKTKEPSYSYNSDKSYENDDSQEFFGNPERLKIELNDIVKELEENDRKVKNLDGEIKDLQDKLLTAYDLEYRLKEKVNGKEAERKYLQEESYKLIDKKCSLKERIDNAKQRKLNNKNKSQADVEREQKEAQNVKLEDLFKENEPIENTVLYAAIFFPKVSPQDFEKVVSYLLEKRTISVKVQSRVTLEQGDTRLIEEYQDKSLVSIWQESLYQPEQYLGKCYLRSDIQEDKSQIIDFYIDLRDRLKDYLKKNQSLYLSAQFKRARYLLFNESEKIADNAMELVIEMATTSPSSYGEDWLFDIITELTSQSDKSSSLVSEALQHLVNKPAITRKTIILKRIASLITQMLSSSQLGSIARKFLQKLETESRFNDLMEIIEELKTAPKFDQFYWIRRLIDQENLEIRDQACSFLYNQLIENNNRIYDLLEIIKSWVPDEDLSVENYSESNKFALRLVFQYCMEITSQIEPKDYGFWQDKNKNPLFAFLITTSINDELLVRNRIETLVAYLFHHGLEDLIKEEKIDDIQQSQDDGITPEMYLKLMIGFLITEWSKFLTPDDKWFTIEKQSPKDFDPKASKIFEILLEVVIQKTKDEQQKELLDVWNSLSDIYLYEGESDEPTNNRKLRKQANLNWKNVRRVSKQFRALRKDIKQSYTGEK